MADFHLSWSIQGETQLSRALLGMGNRLRDFSEPFGEAASVLTVMFSNEVFATRGAIIGEKWKRLSPYTVSQKARKGYPSDPLIATGQMQRSFQSIVSTDQVVITNTAEYFKYHQSNLPRERIQRRVMMKIAGRQREAIVKIFQQFIRQALS